MKRYIPLFLGIAVMGLFIFGCETIVDQEQIDGVLQSPGKSAGESTTSVEITREMCMSDPGWRALGYRNLGQCLRYVQSGTGSPPPTVNDIDGNVYLIVKIGDQWWMAENLKVTKYNNGDNITTGLGDTDWSVTTDGAYAIYPHDGGYSEDDVDGIGSNEEMLAAYGVLYNWYAVNDSRGLCPVGWHVPSDDEWNGLGNYLGGELEAGGKLKSTRTEPLPHPRWQTPNNDATNESGFTGFPGGRRIHNGEFITIGAAGYWWSSTIKDDYTDDPGTEYALGRWLSYFDGNLKRGRYPKEVGFSVRCIKY